MNRLLAMGRRFCELSLELSCTFLSTLKRWFSACVTTVVAINQVDIVLEETTTELLMC